MNFVENIYTENCTHVRTPRHPSATTSICLGFCLLRGHMPPIMGRNDLHGINEAGPLSDYGTSCEHTRTVSHYDTYEKYRIQTKGKYKTVTDKENRVLNEYSSQIYTESCTHWRRTPRYPSATTIIWLGFCRLRGHMPSVFLTEQSSWRI